VAASRAHFGSLDVRVDATPAHLDLLPVHFRVWPEPDDASTPDVELTIVDTVDARPRVEGLDDELVVDERDGEHRITTSITELLVELHRKPVRALLTIAPSGQNAEFVSHYVVMNLRALLRRLGRIQLHGAAIAIGDRTVVFLGEKGAGKSTLSLALGRAGGTVLADDQLMLHVDDAVHVSGVGGGLRLTAESEEHFFTAPLDLEPQDFAGTLKKELRLRDHVAAAPGVDMVPSACFFPRVHDRVSVVPISRAVAAHRLLDALVPLHRFAGASDQLEFVRAITTFLAAVEVFDLTLSPDLRDLDALVRMLADGGP
jgi:hypothetical protein